MGLRKSSFVGSIAGAVLLGFGLASIPARAANEKPTTGPATRADAVFRSPEETIASMKLPEGYHLELIASEPIVDAPVAIAWDGNGRMYVAEMRTYMRDIDDKKWDERVSQVLRLEDTKGDGHYDKHTVFADKLLLPRMILPLDDRVLINETNTTDLYCYRDTKGDGVADEKTQFYKGNGRGQNLEHQPSGLIWNLDNWMYDTSGGTRFRYTRGKLESEGIYSRFAQWGLSQDDVGKMYYSSAGFEQPAFSFQQPIIYGKIELPNELSNGFTECWPICHMPDVEGGPNRLRPNVTLNHFTGCCGQSIFRGDHLPQDLYGDFLLCEPVGRLIRRAKVTVVGGKTILNNAYDKSEFIASTDPNFRPVNSATGPDGCLYICDMYRGIIQEGSWVKEGSYLRKQVKAYDLDKNTGRGRIYRLVHDGMKPGPQPHMLDQKPAELVQYLSHPNGWWRDTAQKLIILRGDKSVVGALQQLARNGPSVLGRMHALWTLEGLDAADKDLITEKLKDSDPKVRLAAVRISENWLKEKDKDPAILSALKPLEHDPDPSVVIQYVLTNFRMKVENADQLADAAIASNKNYPTVREVVKAWRDVVEEKRKQEEKDKAQKLADAKKAEIVMKGKEIYLSSCISCHGPDGVGAPVPDAPGQMLGPPLKGSKRLLADKARPPRIVLYGFMGELNGKNYPGQMPGLSAADDEWIASALNYARNSWGNNAPIIEPADVAKARKETEGREASWTVKELDELKVGK